MRRHLLLLLALTLLAPPVPAAEHPSPDQLRAQAERCRDILRESLINFYLPACLDLQNGGYHEVLRDGRFAGNGEKFLTLQARHLWFFSTLAAEGFEKERALAAARHGYEFIRAKMHDPVRGGYYSKVTDEGEPKDRRKHAYLNAFALYAFTAYHRASGEPAPLAAARELFHVLEEKAYDPEFGGYIEFFHPDWTPVTEPNASGYVGAIGHKTYNTHLHLLEAFAELYRAWPDDLVRQRLQELITINASTVHFPTVNSNVDAFSRSWEIIRTPRNLRASYGHDAECIWLVLDAVRTIGLAPSLLDNWARGLAETACEFGYDREHGGFYSGGPLGEPADDLKKIWWVQAEALLGMLEMYRRTGELKYYQIFLQTLDFCENHHVAKDGGWWATRAPDGAATPDQTRIGPWQGAYHAARALIYAANWLEDLAAPRE